MSETMLDLIGRHRRRRRMDRRQRGRVQAANVTKTELDEELCRRIRASVLLAGPLLARFGSAIVPPPGGDVIGRRRVDTHIHAFEKLGATIEADRRSRCAPTGSSGERVPRRGERDGDRERHDGGDLARGETMLGNAASRAARPGSLPLPRRARRGHRRHRLERAAGRRRRARFTAASTRSAGSHRGGRASSDSARSPSGEIVIEDCRPEDLVAILPVFARLGVEIEFEDTASACPTVRTRDRGRPRRPHPEDRRRAVARVPGRPDVDRGRPSRRRRRARC